MKIVELQNKIVAYEGRIAELMAGEPTDESVREAKAIVGRLSECRDMLMAEAKRVADENEAMAMAAKTAPKAQTVIERVLGPVDAFSGIEPGWKVTVDTSYAPAALPIPEKYDTDLPGAVRLPAGIVSTLPQARTNEAEHYFQQPAFDNKAAAWTEGSKAQSGIEWPLAVANLETIAHYIPVPKLAVRRYRNLESTISGALLMGLEQVKDAHVVKGSNASGIVGLANQTGIQTYTKGEAENIYDIVVKMAAKVRVKSGFAPDCVAMPTSVWAAIKTAKGVDGHYLYPEIVQNGTIDGLRIVIDENLAVASGGTITNGIMVYFSGAAQFLVADPDEVTIGLVDKQFIQNAYTLLAEGTYALKVPIPAGFCYCSSVSTEQGGSAE